MKQKFRNLTIRFYGAVAVALVAIMTMPILIQPVSAGSLVASRAIKMSDSTPGASSVTYHVSFTAQSNVATAGYVVQFCDNSPIIASTTCTHTASTSASPTASPAVANLSATSGCVITTFTTTTALDSNYAVGISNATPVTFTSAPCAISFDITTMLNPTNANQTFYARIYAFPTQAGVTGYTVASPGAYGDYGGDALSTASVLQLTAKVMETLTFCTSAVAPGAGCTSLTAPNGANATIGHTSGGQTILDGTAADNLTLYTQTSTNAQSGVTTRMKATNLGAGNCAGLSSDSGATCGIAALGASVLPIAAGTAAIGMCVTPGSANTTADAPYNTSGCSGSAFAFDQTTANNNLIATYGNTIFHSTGTLSNEQDNLIFRASAATTTKAGVYTGSYAVICTGTF